MAYIYVVRQAVSNIFDLIRPSRGRGELRQQPERLRDVVVFRDDARGHAGQPERGRGGAVQGDGRDGAVAGRGDFLRQSHPPGDLKEVPRLAMMDEDHRVGLAEHELLNERLEQEDLVRQERFVQGQLAAPEAAPGEGRGQGRVALSVVDDRHALVRELEGL